VVFAYGGSVATFANCNRKRDDMGPDVEFKRGDAETSQRWYRFNEKKAARIGNRIEWDGAVSSLLFSKQRNNIPGFKGSSLVPETMVSPQCRWDGVVMDGM
jgi:hypothetical protein